MSTTPPTILCWRCGGAGWFGYVDKKHKVQRISCPTCYGTGVVAAEAEKQEVVNAKANLKADFQRYGHPAPTAEAKCPECGRTDKSAPCLTCNPTPPAATDDGEVGPECNCPLHGDHQHHCAPCYNCKLVVGGLDEILAQIYQEDGMSRENAHAALEAHYAVKESAAYDSGFNNGYDEADMLWRVALETGLKITVQAENQFAAAQEIEAHYAAKERERVVKMQTELVDPFIDPDFGTVDIKGVGEATMAYIERYYGDQAGGSDE